VAGIAVVIGLIQAHRGWRREVRVFHVADVAMLDGRRLEFVQVQWRGPLAFLHARDVEGRTHRCAWWPDTLAAKDRRALRLAMDAMRHPARGAKR
jgi:hypothetical protein